MARSRIANRSRSWTDRLLRALRRLRRDSAVGVRGEGLSLPTTCLEALSPFFLLLDSRGRVLTSGASLGSLLGDHEPRGRPMHALVVELDGGDSRDLCDVELDALKDRLLRLELKACPGLEFAGQLVPVWSGANQDRNRGEPKHWILDLRPILETLEDLEASGLSLQDLSLLDPMRVSMVSMLMEASLRQELLDGISVESLLSGRSDGAEMDQSF